jgi:hypothetical protein
MDECDKQGFEYGVGGASSTSNTTNTSAPIGAAANPFDWGAEF